ncbi:hypothetical protein VKT23_019681 [Stygiomarasmius scandens]|uniref:Uncharacterized protein n=1 Tax=Marasmiellus scandens TaxID=2682957 RepID=A0ABR1IKS8_9AGAR
MADPDPNSSTVIPACQETRSLPNPGLGDPERPDDRVLEWVIETGTHSMEPSSASRLPERDGRSVGSSGSETSPSTAVSKICFDESRFKDYIERMRCSKDAPFSLPEIATEYDIHVVWEYLLVTKASSLDEAFNMLDPDLQRTVRIHAADHYNQLEQEVKLGAPFETVHVHFERAALARLPPDVFFVPETYLLNVIPKKWAPVFTRCIDLLLHQNPSSTLSEPNPSLLDCLNRVWLDTFLSSCFVEVRLDWSLYNLSERIVRKSLDKVIDFWNMVPGFSQEPWTDYQVFPPKPPTENPPNDPAHYFKPDLIIRREFRIGPSAPIALEEALQHASNLVGDQKSKYLLEFTSKMAEYNAFIRSINPVMPILCWSPHQRKPGRTVFELIALVIEYKTTKRNFQQAINQCVVDLIASSFILEVLDIPHPAFGLAISNEKCYVLAARATFTNGSMSYKVQIVHEWGDLSELSHFLNFASFMKHHQQWFIDTVHKCVTDRTSKDPHWVEEKLQRVKDLKPWVEPKKGVDGLSDVDGSSVDLNGL